MKRSIFSLLATMVMTSGCVSMSGLTDSSSTFACKAPDGVSCTSVSGVYANAQQNNLPALQSRGRAASLNASVPANGTVFPVMTPGMPIRSQSRTLRIWLAPWVDDEGTLHDQSYMYVMIDPGKWLVERSREATVKKAMTRLRPLGKQRTGSTSEPSTGQLADARNDRAALAAAQEAAALPATQEDAQ